jgi:HAD superfamily hydrolase (TIGR01509 family)
MINHLVLDVGGVLIYPGGLTDDEKAAIAEEGLDLETFQQIREEHKDELYRGDYSFGKLVNEYNRQTGQTFTLHDVQQIFFENIRINQDLIEFCEDSACNVSLVANNCRAQVVFLNKYLNVKDWTTTRMYSYKYRAVKEEPTLYERLLRKLEAEPDECVYVDDESSYVEQASSLGIQTVPFTTTEDTLDQLKKMAQ